MTINEAVNADLGRAGVTKVEEFSKSFRVDDLSNIEAGDSFIMPENYTVLRRTMVDENGQPRRYNGEVVCAEYIKVETTTGKIVNFFPSSITKTAFRVDPETGKDVVGPERIVRTKGNLVTYCKDHPDINVTLKALAGCEIKCDNLEPVTVRNFGVRNEKATKADIAQRPNNVGTWILTPGTKRPADWPEALG